MLKRYNGHKVYMNGKYPAVFINGKNAHVHRLVWIEHFGEIPKGMIVHHKDENKLNWNIENLELISRASHILKHQHSLHTDSFIKVGEESRHHKLTQSEVDYIRKVYMKYDKNFGGRALAKRFNVTEACISQIVLGKNWR